MFILLTDTASARDIIISLLINEFADSQVSCETANKNMVLSLATLANKFPIDVTLPVSIRKDDGQVTQLHIQIL